jgi:hypothetical protein
LEGAAILVNMGEAEQRDILVLVEIVTVKVTTLRALLVIQDLAVQGEGLAQVHRPIIMVITEAQPVVV